MQEKNNNTSLLAFAFFIVFGLVAANISYLVEIWPDWSPLKSEVPVSRYMAEYDEKRVEDPSLPARQWVPVSTSRLRSFFKKTFVLAEDSRFYAHHGVDFEALFDAIRHNWNRGRMRIGASTISQQTVKNLYLSFDRNPIRKLNEMILTLSMEESLSKDEILNIYLNIIEFGSGIFGIKAAARYYWKRSAINLRPWQVAELAATLPSPVKHNPETRTPQFLRRAWRIKRAMRLYSRYLASRHSRPQSVVIDNIIRKVMNTDLMDGINIDDLKPSAFTDEGIKELVSSRKAVESFIKETEKSLYRRADQTQEAGDKAIKFIHKMNARLNEGLDDIAGQQIQNK